MPLKRKININWTHQQWIIWTIVRFQARPSQFFMEYNEYEIYEKVTGSFFKWQTKNVRKILLEKLGI